MFFAAVATLAVIAATTATATAVACQLADEQTHLVVGGVACQHYVAAEVESLASQRVVQVHDDRLVANVEHAGHKAVALLILQRHDGVDADVLVIEAAVDAEHFAVEFQHAFLLVVAVGLLGCEREVELGSVVESYERSLEIAQHDAESADEGEGLVGSSLFHDVASRLVFGKELVGHGNEFVFCCLHIYKIGVS